MDTPPSATGPARPGSPLIRFALPGFVIGLIVGGLLGAMLPEFASAPSTAGTQGSARPLPAEPRDPEPLPDDAATPADPSSADAPAEPAAPGPQ